MNATKKTPQEIKRQKLELALKKNLQRRKNSGQDEKK